MQKRYFPFPLFAFLLISLMGVLPLYSNACTCIGETKVEHEIENVDAVLVGKIISKEIISIPIPDMIELYPNDTLRHNDYPFVYTRVKYILKADRIYKGKFKDGLINIITGQGGGDCGFEFQVGEKYIVYGEKKSGDEYESIVENKHSIWTDICRRTQPYNEEEIKAIEAFRKPHKTFSNLSIPSFESNATCRDTLASPMYKLVGHKFESVIALRTGSFGRTIRSYFYVLGLSKRGKWYQITYVRDEATGKVSHKPKRRIREMPMFLEDPKHFSQFLSLDADSLNLTEVWVLDTIIDWEIVGHWKSVAIADGITYVFEVITPTHHRRISSHSPRSFYKALPEIWQRKVFIDFLDAFEEIWKK